MTIKTLLETRYATKSFDADKKVSDADIDTITTSIQLAPSSFGLQPFKVIVVTDAAVKEKLQAAAWNQPQITSCSHLFVFCAIDNDDARINEYEQMMIENGSPADKAKVYTDMMRGAVLGKSKEEIVAWNARQIYLALENGMLQATELGFASCPMEGFDAKAFAEILGVGDSLVPIVLMPVGYATDEARPKLRYSKEKLFDMR